MRLLFIRKPAKRNDNLGKPRGPLRQTNRTEAEWLERPRTPIRNAECSEVQSSLKHTTHESPESKGSSVCLLCIHSKAPRHDDVLYIYAAVRVSMHIYIYTHTHMYTHLRAHVYTQLCAYINIFMYVYMSLHRCICMRMYFFIYIHINFIAYIYIYTHELYNYIYHRILRMCCLSLHMAASALR